MEKFAVPTKKQLESATCAYLYPNGVVVLRHERSDLDAGIVQYETMWKTGIVTWVDNAETYPSPPVGFILRRNLLAIIWKGNLQRVTIWRNNASEKTKAYGLNLDTITLKLPGYEVRIHCFLDVLSSDIETLDWLADPKNLPDYEDVMRTGWHGTQRIANTKGF